MRTIFAAGLLALLVPACLDSGITGVGGDEMGSDQTGGGGDTGGGDTGGGGNTATPRITATVDKATMTTELGKTETLTVTITGTNGFSGSVPITTALLDGATPVTGFTITANPATVDLTTNGTATATITVKIPTNAAALTPKLEVDLGGSAPTTASANLAITNQLVIDIPSGTGTGAPHTGLPAINAPIRVKAGAKVIFHNSDNRQHVIHADGGINHENTALGMPGTDYSATPSGDATWYCHDHESPTQARRIIVE